MTQKAYFFGELEVFDAPYFYREYMPRIRNVLRDYGAKFLFAQDNPENLEGDRTIGRVVLVEFDSEEKARACFTSPTYRAAVRHKFASSTGSLYLVTGPISTEPV